jgi:thioredoxin-related protein
MVRQFHVEGYPTVIVLDSSGKEIRRLSYTPSKQMVEILRQQ